ncbi:hypothetical protein MMC21_006861 [Puttea exsequens]|nr:hypothetical protein [Puttea exsequens]
MGGGHNHQPDHLLVILPYSEPTETLERLKKLFPYIRITFRSLQFANTFWEGIEAIDPEIYRDATILLTLSALPPGRDWCPKLGAYGPFLNTRATMLASRSLLGTLIDHPLLTELIHFCSAGTNHIQTSPIYTSTDIQLTTSSGIHGPQIAEWVILTMLAHSHHYSMLHAWQKEHNWGKRQNKDMFNALRDKVGQRLGVLGYGSIGRQVARVGQAMGMEVVAYTASPRTTPESKHDKGFIVPGTGDPEGVIPHAWFNGLDKKSLHNFLAQDLDHLLVSVPLTKETMGFLGKEEFAILGKTKNAFVTNISRGPIISQPDLIASLESYASNDPLRGGDGGGGLRGAALDVTEPEPLPKEDPLWEAPNLILTPHISGLGANYMDRVFEVLEENLGRRERGERLINVVNREKGY